jgi:hypothetical protein
MADTKYHRCTNNRFSAAGSEQAFMKFYQRSKEPFGAPERLRMIQNDCFVMFLK